MVPKDHLCAICGLVSHSPRVLDSCLVEGRVCFLPPPPALPPIPLENVARAVFHHLLTSGPIPCLFSLTPLSLSILLEFSPPSKLLRKLLCLFITARPANKGMVEKCDGTRPCLKAVAVDTWFFTHSFPSRVGAKAATANGDIVPHLSVLPTVPFSSGLWMFICLVY